MIRGWTFNFKDAHEPTHTIIHAQEIADKYGCVTVADMHDLIGIKSTYTDNKYGWTSFGLSDARIKMDTNKTYSIYMPPCDWFADDWEAFKNEKEDNKMASSYAKEIQAEPINISISADKPELIEQTINALFNNTEKIKNRPVFITIM